jgi:hypothetical protein
MAYPQFSAPSMTTLVFSRGNVFPVQHVYVPRQRIGYSEGGMVKVASLGLADERFPLRFERLPLADYTALVAWFQHALINWAEHTFTYTDVASVATTVRYIDDTFDMPEIAYQLYSVNLLLRKELA